MASAGIKVAFDYAKLQRLKKKYTTTHAREFEFEGHLYLKDYAKYLIQYMDLKMQGEIK